MQSCRSGCPGSRAFVLGAWYGHPALFAVHGQDGDTGRGRVCIPKWHASQSLLGFLPISLLFGASLPAAPRDGLCSLRSGLCCSCIRSSKSSDSPSGVGMGVENGKQSDH